VRAGSWGIAAAVIGGIGFALWSSQSIPDPVGRGSSAPAFTLPQRPGPGDTSLASLRGQVVLLNFWATWCEPCEREMPAMERLHEKLSPEGLRLVAVSVDETSDVVEQFRTRFGLSFEILWDADKRVANTYQAFKYPETLLIDRDGVVVERYIGPREWDSPLYEARLRRLLEGKDAS
jgi:peroxiredoxin